MSPLDVADNQVADPHDGTVAYVPPLERTAGQAEPIAAHVCMTGKSWSGKPWLFVPR